jgi:hypothetical protein
MGYGTFLFGVLYLGDGRWRGAIGVILGMGIFVSGVLLLIFAGTGRLPKWALARLGRGTSKVAG